MSGKPDPHAPFVPRISAEWEGDSLWQSVDGSLVFVDISGFTNLSERLARKGRIGAEELTGVLNRVFGRMLNVAFERGGSLLKFGGDALLLFFNTKDHVMQACAATVEMRAALRDASKAPTSVGRISLKMSSGIHTGPVDFFLVGDSHRELIVTGPTASTATDMEETADAGEILVSSAIKEHLPASFIGNPKGDGWLLRKQKINHPPGGVRPRAAVPDNTYSTRVSTGLCQYLGTGIAEPEHRVATIGFIKFRGVDPLLAQEGPERVGEELDSLIRTVQRAVDAEGTTFLATDIDADGGKIILSAGVPTSQHDDEGRMLRAAREILDSKPGLPIRVGVNRGHVFSGNVGTEFRATYTVMGDTVNLAARLMAAADPGSLYATPAVLDRSSTLFRTEALEPFYVKGKEQPVQAYEVLEETGTRTTEASRDLPFHGRPGELDLIVTIVTTCAREGRGGMMTITGDTGLGKSRLIAEVLERCPGLDTMTVQAEPNGADNPYWAFRDPMRKALSIERGSSPEMADALNRAVERVAPDLLHAVPLLGDVFHIDIPDNDETAAIDPKFRPDRTADAVLELLEALYDGPFAVLAEDGHWMDDASIQLLRHIGAEAEARPWTVIFTARREGTGFEPLGDEIALKPLSDEAIRTIAIEATETAPLRPHEMDEVVARAGGNPLFLSELLSMIRTTGSAENLPESLGAVVSFEIDTLPPLSRQLLRYASVLGRSFPRAILDQYLEPELVAMDEATRAQLGGFLESENGRLKFKHAVVHDVAYQGLSYRRRRELHERAGDVIERMSGDDVEAAAERLATHFSEAGTYDKAWTYSMMAAAKARRAYANSEAAAHYRTAAEVARHVDHVRPADIADVWINHGDVVELAGQMELSRESFAHAAQLTDHPIKRAEIHLRRAGTWMNSGNLTQARRSVTLGMKELDGTRAKGKKALLARLTAFEASVLGDKGDPVGAKESAERAVTLASASGEETALARAYGVLDWANVVMGIDEPLRGSEAIAIYNNLGLLERSVVLMNNMGAYAYFAGDWNGALGWYQESLEASEKSGNVVDAANTRANIAEVLINQRHYDTAEPLVAEADRVLQASNTPQLLPFVGLQRGRLLAGLGRTDEAVVVLEPLVSAQLSGEPTDWTAETALSLAETLVHAVRPSEALDVLARFEQEAPEFAEYVPAGIGRVRAHAESLNENHEAAEQLISSALEIAVEMGDPFEEALVRETRALMRIRAGSDPDPDDRSVADELFSSLGVVS